MSRPANVSSIDALHAFKLALQTFAEDASDALVALGLEVNRALEWIDHDRSSYWPQQVRRSWDMIGEARVALERRRTMKMGGHEPSCREEKEALMACRRRLRAAEEKVDAVRHWSRMVHREALEFQGGLGPLARWIETDCPRALAGLERMIAALESYTSVAVSAGAVASKPTVRAAGKSKTKAADDEIPTAESKPASDGGGDADAESDE